ncbi:MAG: nucleotide exchange factor GrpE [Dehalococcoidia bacterium]|nr:nucleotide exchange factor GrpE [Dehalococcoidia bacterium]
MPVRPLDAIRHFLGHGSPEPRNESPAHAGQAVVRHSETGRSHAEPEAGEAAEQDQPDTGLPASESATGDDSARSSQLARHMASYLKARAEETLASLLDEISREMAARSSQALDHTRQDISAEIAGVREDVLASSREFSRLGREFTRWGATLESIQTVISSVGPNMERLESSLRNDLVRELASDRQLREVSEREALDDMLAALDGLEAGQQDGRELLQALGGVQRRLSDATAQRWWRAMAEATGVKRKLPEIPMADLESWINGLELTYRRLQDALGRRGVAPIEAVGKPFDPYLHEAVAVEPCPLEQGGIVLREQRKGYRTADRVVRLSQVVVGRGEPGKGNSQPSRRSTEEAKE